MSRPGRALIRAANRLTTTPAGVGSLRHVLPGLSTSPAELRKAVAGKTVLITGASSGIGAATARAVGAAGAHVLLIARRGSELREVRDDIERGGGTADV